MLQGVDEGENNAETVGGSRIDSLEQCGILLWVILMRTVRLASSLRSGVSPVYTSLGTLPRLTFIPVEAPQLPHPILHLTGEGKESERGPRGCCGGKESRGTANLATIPVPSSTDCPAP